VVVESAPPGAAGAPLTKRWPVARAILITAAIVFSLIDGYPVPSDHSLEHWPARFVPLGHAVQRAQATLASPIAWFANGLAVHQRWSLFASADPERFRMWIEAKSASGPWQLLYRPHDDEHAYRAEAIEYRRLRGAWNLYKRGPDAGYPAFVDWVARTILTDPALEFDQVRVRMERLHIRPREASFNGSGEFLYELTRQRSQAPR